MPEEKALDLRQLLAVAGRWWWLFLLGPLLVGVAAYLYTRDQAPMYQARATLLVQQAQNTASPTFSDLQTSQRLASTYQRLITTRPVLEKVIEDLGLPYSPGGLASLVGAQVVRDTELLYVTALNEDPKLAKDIANTLAETFREHMQQQRLAEIAKLQAAVQAQGLADTNQFLTAQLSALGSLSVVEAATEPSRPVSPRMLINVLLGVAVGAVAAGLGIYLLEHFNDKIRAPEDMQTPERENAFGVPNLGMVFRWSRRDVPSGVLFAASRPRSTYTEMFRQVRANLQFALAAHPGKTLLITSTAPQEGKTTLAANLATVLAQGGARVTLVDGDLRRPNLHRIFQRPNERGLSTWLLEPGSATDGFVQETESPGLSLVTSGPIPPNPAELISSEAMERVIGELKARCDLVLFDSPPMIAVADPMALAGKVDAVILVVVLGETKAADLRHVLQRFAQAKIPVLGILFNKVGTRRFGYGYRYPYYRRYYYRRYHSQEDEQGTATGSTNGAGAPHERRSGLAHAWHNVVRFVARND